MFTKKISRVNSFFDRSGAARRGNALIAAMGVVVVVAGVVLVSSTNATQGRKNQSTQQRQTKALAALEAVLSRRESMVTTMALNGNPKWPSLIDWTGSNPANFGMDVVGDCIVRWRIEPGRTVKTGDLPTAPSNLKYIQNPSPDGVAPNADLNAVQNGFSYLFRVAAEAEYPGRNNTESPSLAQGARYISFSAQPTFRWVIDYTRIGPLGDLELSHDPAVRIRGSINSNGAIYFGSNLQVNDWAALAGGSGATVVGPDASNAPVVVNGYDGIYRMSKPNNYGYLNKFPMTNGVTATDPTTLMITQGGTGSAPLFADIPGLDYSSWDTATLKGRFINPYRINNTANLTTLGSAARSINSNNIYGSGSGSTLENDSRDRQRRDPLDPTKPLSFKTQALQAPPTGFNNYARTAQTTARREVLSKEFSNRALEPQAIVYREVDGDVLTDDHDFAIPQFYNPNGAGGAVEVTVDPIIAANGVDTISGANANGNLLVEVPGHYVAKALGSNRAMTRIADGSGWVITDTKGVQLPTSPVVNQSSGLIIRERPVPWTEAWPGSVDPTKYVQYSDPQSLPYALGKHWRPISLPFTPIDVTDNLYRDGNDFSWSNIAPFNQSTPAVGWDRSANYPMRSVLYKYAGNLFMVGAQGVSVNQYSTAIQAQLGNNPSPVGSFSYTPGAQYHNAPWRMVHLKNRYGLTDAQILARPVGLKYSYWNDDARRAGNAAAYARPDQANNFDTGTNDPVRQPLLGPPVVTGVATAIGNALNANPWLPAVAPASVKGDAANFYSVRWEGFLVPPSTGSYVFQVNWDDGVRIWIDDRLLFENWNYIGTAVQTNPVSMIQNHPVKIVIDYNQGTGGHGMALKWSASGESFSDIPTSAMRQPPSVSGFERSKFTSVTMRIKTDALGTISAGATSYTKGLAALTDPKIGLMIRPNAGEPNMINGRDAYLALCWSPTRGVFLERRMNPARVYDRLSVTQNQWIGAGTYQINTPPLLPDVAGVVPIPIGHSGPYGSNTYVVNRTATVTCQPAPTPNQSAVTPSTRNSWNSTTASSPSSASVNLGDGSTANIFYGSYTIVYKQKSFIRKTVTLDRTYTFKIAGGVFPAGLLGFNGFPINGSPVSFSIYADASTASTTNVEYTLNAGQYNVTDSTTITVPQQSTVNVDGTPVYGSAITQGDSGSNNVWKPTGGWPSGYTGATLVARLNAIQFQGRSDWQLGNGTGDAPKAPSTFDVLNPIAPADPSPASLPVIYDTMPHSFSMNVTPGYTLYVDTNPFVSRTGKWNSSDVNLNRPWNLTWSNSTYGFTQALTAAFRPDLAADPALGTGSPALIETSSANAPAVPTPAIGTVAMPPVPWADDVPVTVAGNSVWLRMTRDSASNSITFQYSTGLTSTGGVNAPGVAWTNLSLAEQVLISNPEWDSMLIGPAIQSGNVDIAIQAELADLSVVTSESIGNNDGVLNWKDWDNVNAQVGQGTPLSRYYASQYQVFYGIYDITEDFFTWGDQTGNDPIATEEWFYQPREFWSQSDTFQYWSSAAAYSTQEPWGVTAVPRPDDNIPFTSRWNPAKGWISAYTGGAGPISNPYANDKAALPTSLLKDVGASNPYGDLTNRQNWAKVTVLVLDLKSLWAYLGSRDLIQAKTPKIITGSGAVPAFVGPSLASNFNGLVYAARTNRYPFNPNQPLTEPSVDVTPATASAPATLLDPTRIGGVNPWSSLVRTTPGGSDPWEFNNSITPSLASPKSAAASYGPLSVGQSGPNWTPSGSVTYYQDGALVTRAGSMTLGGVHKLQPYSEISVYPIRPQQFIQGVMLKNGDSINWGTGNVPNFGTGGTSIVTPNALYVKGDFNTSTSSVKVNNVPTNKLTPVAVMGDSVTLLSKSFSIPNFQQAGLIVASNGVISGGGILANPSLAFASTTTYNMGIITHNQPTTQARVLEGQGAAFIDTMMFIENWTGTTMNFTGSLVVMDTRRYTDAFLLDGNKGSGRSPLGYLGWAATVENGRSGPGLPLASVWTGLIPKVYTAPARNLDYQFDFRTAAGTPPFVPNGMTTVGVGGWTRVLQ